MINIRIIPCLLLKNNSLVKTVKFKEYSYIGDPVNTARIFNELEVDELALIDISASRENRQPDFEMLHQVADECFMPLSYGGGIRTIEDAARIFTLGFEKIILNTAAFRAPGLIKEIADHFGSQAVTVAVDVRKNIWGKHEVYSLSGTVNEKRSPVEWVKEVEQRGAGEILLTSIDREGTWTGFDINLIREVSESSTIPIIAHGGAGSLLDIEKAVKEGKASAVALGSMVVFQKKGLGVLINFPDKVQLEQALK